jgi:hypothetical protein
MMLQMTGVLRTRLYIWSVEIHCRWGDTMSLNCGLRRVYSSAPGWYMSMESHGGMILTGENLRTRKTTCPKVTLSIKNFTWADPSANPGLCCERPVPNRLSHGTAHKDTFSYIQCFLFKASCFVSVYLRAHRLFNGVSQLSNEWDGGMVKWLGWRRKSSCPIKP